jgi:hypothetical protein
VILPSVILVCILVYLGDVLSLQYSIPKRDTYGTVMVRQMYAITLKSKETEYSVQPAAPQECVNSLFGHFGDPPCWYLKGHTRQRIDVNSAQPQIFGR